MSVVQDLRHRGSKGGSIDMEAQESTSLLRCPEQEVSYCRLSNFFEPVEPFKVEVSLVSPTPRRLVVMFDGTSNMRNSLTNVSRFFEAIDDSRPTDYTVVNHETILEKINGREDCSEEQPVLCSTCQHEKDTLLGELPTKGPDAVCPECKKTLQKRAQLVHYVRGVGSKWYDGFGSVLFGAGLSDNVKNGYKWLVNNYRDGDEIFVFGFSRGAFSARSFVSLLHRCGGVPVPKDGGSPVLNGALQVPKTPEEKAAINGIVDDAYAMYQAFDPKHPSRPAYLQKGRNLYDRIDRSGKRMQRVTVAMLGVWDTVGAVGLRSIRFLDILYYHISSRHYEFHDQDLPCIVEHAYHALAIDERRYHFAPTLWTVPRPDPDSKIKVNEVPSLSDLECVANPANTKQIPLREVKQVWFMGSHCNVGGGADLDDVFDPDDLWQYSYVWMQKHAEKLGLRFYWNFETPTEEKGSSTNPTKLTYISHRQPERSYEKCVSGLYRCLFLPFYRHVTASINTRAAKVHWSVVQRIKVDEVKLVEEERIKAKQERIKAEQERIKAEQERIKAEQERIKAEEEQIKNDADKAVKRKTGTCIARLKNTLCFWKETEEEVKKFEPYRPESLFKERPTRSTIWSPREWIWSKLTLLLCTLGFSKTVEDDSKLEVAKDGEITLSGTWKNQWPWVEFDDLKTVPVDEERKLNSCNCHSELRTEFDKVEDTRWLLRKGWDCWVNWWPL